MNVELRMWTAKLAVPEGRQSNFELVARRAMKNYSIKNYLASYSMFLLVSPSLLGRDGRGFFIASFNHKPYGSNLFRENLGALHRKPYLNSNCIASILSIRFLLFFSQSMMLSLAIVQRKRQGLWKLVFISTKAVSCIDAKGITMLWEDFLGFS